MRIKYGADILLMTTVLVLIGLGVVMIYSSSAILAQEKFGEPTYFLWKQLLWIGIGIFFLILFCFIPYKNLRHWVKLLLFVSLLLLVMVLFFGKEVSGAKRWLRIGGIGFQPSELAKLVLILFTADYCDRRKSKMTSFRKGLAPFLLILALFCGLIFIQPDLGTPALIAATCLTMVFISGARISHLLILSCLVILLAFAAIWSEPYRRGRFLSYLNPWQQAEGASYQLVQSFLAMGSGGIFGVGPGESRSKLLYLPEPHTDFIFPVFAEEFGLIGSWTLISLFGLLALGGFSVARHSPNLFASLLSSGITLAILYQVIFNIGVVTGLLPTKGLPLPFISFGGSSMVTLLSAMGILLNISRSSKTSPKFNAGS